MSTQDESSGSTGPKLSCTVTSETFTASPDARPQTSSLDIAFIASPMSTSSVAGSHAKTSVSPVREPDSLALAPVSGGSLRASSTRSARRGSLSRTSRRSEPAGCELSSATFTRAGTMRSGIVYPRLPSVLVTRETASSLLPTLSASRYGSNRGGAAGRLGKVRHSLDSLAKLGRLPHHKAGPLSPTWAETFMGFPIGWTALGVSGML